MPNEIQIPRSGIWHLKSKKDPRWDRTGQYSSLVGEPPLMIPLEAQEALDELKSLLGEGPPDDLKQITLPYPSPKFKRLFDCHVFAAADKQTLFQSLTLAGEGGLTEVSLNTREGVLSLGKPGKGASYRLPAQFIGLLDLNQVQWQWGWVVENTGILDPATLRSASMVKNYGIEHEIPELTYEMIPLGQQDDRPWFNADYLVMASAHLCQADFYVGMSVAEAPGFLMYWVVKAPELLPKPPSESRRFFDVIREAMSHWASALQGTDGREVVRAYSDHKGYTVAGVDNHRLRVDTLSGENLFIQFDESGNIAGIDLPEERPARPETGSLIGRLFGAKERNRGH